ncbi:MAG TPA: hypothetical protein VF120_13960, partial [Ktedonobacterales bacterium]
PGRPCEHNLTYWRNLPYIGLGAGAHSWYARSRFVEVRSIREYTTRVTAAASGGTSAPETKQPVAPVVVGQSSADFPALPAAAVVEVERIPPELEMAETAMMGLRLAQGLRLDDFYTRFGTTFGSVFGEALREVVALGLVEQTDEAVRLTPRGMLLGNEVFERLLPDA